MFNKNASFFKILLVAWVLIALVLIWDQSVLEAKLSWHYWMVKLGTLGSILVITVQTYRQRNIETLQTIFMIIFFIYSFYGLAFIDMTYHYSFIEAFLFFSFVLVLNFRSYLFLTIFGFGLFLFALYICPEPPFVAKGFSYKPHALVATSIIAFCSSVFYYFITNYRMELYRLNEQFALIGKQSSFLMHEIKNPLNRVVQRMESMQSDQFVDQIKEDSARISSIVQGVETLVSRPDEFNKTFEAFKWEDLVRALEGDFKNILASSGISLKINGFEGEGFGNKYLLFQVLKNLTTNAFEAIGFNQSNNPEIIILLDKQNSDARIKFMNTHSLIPKAEFHRIFEPLYTTKNNRKNKGLGLTFVKSIIEAHKGTVDVNSGNNVTTFNLYLPKANV